MKRGRCPIASVVLAVTLSLIYPLAGSAEIRLEVGGTSVGPCTLLVSAPGAGGPLATPDAEGSATLSCPYPAALLAVTVCLQEVIDGGTVTIACEANATAASPTVSSNVSFPCFAVKSNPWIVNATATVVDDHSGTPATYSGSGKTIGSIDCHSGG